MRVFPWFRGWRTGAKFQGFGEGLTGLRHFGVQILQVYAATVSRERICPLVLGSYGFTDLRLFSSGSLVCKFRVELLVIHVELLSKREVATQGLIPVRPPLLPPVENKHF